VIAQSLIPMVGIHALRRQFMHDHVGCDNGLPGVRAHYHLNYYGAFVLDPDGNNVEAVYHGPA
jgi:hypothetical protein